MSKADDTALSLASFPVRLWARLREYLHERNERQVAAWGSALQYKRRYTNPDTAKRYRQNPDEGSGSRTR